MANFWTKKYNKINKSTYDIAQELNVSEDKIKEIINGEREVPHDDVDRVVQSFSTNKLKVSSMERALMEQYFKENDIDELIAKFGYKSRIDLGNAIGTSNTTIARCKNSGIKTLSDNLLKKVYDFFQNEWNIKVKDKDDKKVTKKGKFEKTHYYILSRDKISDEILNWYENANFNQLLKKNKLNQKQLLFKLGFDWGYYATLCRILNKKIKHGNFIAIVQLYNYFHKKELLNVTATTEEELYGNINTPIFEFEEKPKEEVTEMPSNDIAIDCSQIEKSVEEEPKVSSAMFIEYSEYQKLEKELERYRWLIDKLMESERK